MTTENSEKNEDTKQERASAPVVSNKLKILIVIGDVGNGHRSGANAIKVGLEEVFGKDKVDIQIGDLFRDADLPVFKHSEKSYNYFTEDPLRREFNNMLFNLTNTVAGFWFFATLGIIIAYDKAEEYLDKHQPDLIISVHPVISIAIGRYVETHPQVKFATVATDLVTMQRGWATRNADIVFCPTVQASSSLIDYGLRGTKIIPGLFPINPNFNKARSAKSVLEELKLETKGKYTVLLTGGGLATQSVVKHLDDLISDAEMQFIIIAGKQEDLKKELEVKYSSFNNVAILGYVNNMQDYINAADLIIAKPGPATILEIEIMQKKCLLLSPVGEQEKGNINFARLNPNFLYIEDMQTEDFLGELKTLLKTETDFTPRHSAEDVVKIAAKIKKLFEVRARQV